MPHREELRDTKNSGFPTEQAIKTSLLPYGTMLPRLLWIQCQPKPVPAKNVQ
jgi:hypothetical protein